MYTNAVRGSEGVNFALSFLCLYILFLSFYLFLTSTAILSLQFHAYLFYESIP